MRSVWFALFDATLEKVDRLFSDLFYDGPNEGPGYRWYYPRGTDSVLYIDIYGKKSYEKNDLFEEYNMMNQAAGHETKLIVSVDVSGRHPMYTDSTLIWMPLRMVPWGTSECWRRIISIIG